MEPTILEKPKFTIQQILDDHFADYLKSSTRRVRMTDHILKTINQIRCCQTPRLGVYLVGCKSCGTCRPIARSCKNRFCSKCGTSDTMRWVEQLSLKVPDIKHYHVVFTLPLSIRVLVKRNRRKLYNLLFTSSQLAMKTIFEKRYSLRAGMISVLHTNGSDLKYHPHVHTIVSAGGFDADDQLVELDDNYLIPQRVLANKFRSIFMRGLRELLSRDEELRLPMSLRNAKRLNKYLGKVMSCQWIVNIENPLFGAEKIIAYVGRYTKKSCISERRILDVGNGLIKLSYKDYKNSKRGEKPIDGIMTLPIYEFLNRLLQHVPLKGFKVVRYYGLYNSLNLKKIPADKRIKELNFGGPKNIERSCTIETDSVLSSYRKSLIDKTGIDPMYCYSCEQEMSIIEIHYERSNGEIEIWPYEVAITDDG